MRIADIYAKFRFNAEQRKNLYQAFLEYLEQGIPLVNIIELLSKSITRADAGSMKFLIRILNDIELQMSTGVQFAEALARWIPVEEVMSIRAGMRSGNAAEGMRNTIESLDSASRMRKAITSQLSYPIVLFLGFLGLVCFFAVSIIPQIIEVVPPENWPDSTKPLKSLSDFVVNDWYIVLIGGICFVSAIKYSLPRVTGRVRKTLDKLPPYSFYRLFHGANMLISISSLMKSGIPLVNAIKELKTLSSPYMSHHLDEILMNLAEGKDIGSALNTGILSETMMVNVYMMSENANFQAAISAIGKFAVEKSIESITSAAGFMRIMVMFIAGLSIGWIYVSFQSIMASVAQSVAY